MWDKESLKTKHTLEAQLDYRVEARLCGLGTLVRGTLVTIGSGPNSTPPLSGVDGTPGTRQKISCEGKIVSADGKGPYYN